MARILVIDDDPSVRGMLRFISEYEGHSVCAEVDDGLKVLATFESVAPDLVFLDLHLPGRSGLELLADFRRLDPLPLVVVVTGEQDIEVVQQAVRLGAAAYVLKPFGASSIVSLLRRLAKHGPGDYSGRQPRVLVVEDEPAYRAFLRVVVADAGAELVGEAATSTEGRRLVSRLQPDLVIVDIHLPDGNGLDLAEELRAAQKGVQVIVATASSESDCVSRAISANAAAYLLKPFSRTRGAATIRQVLAMPEVPVA